VLFSKAFCLEKSFALSSRSRNFSPRLSIAGGGGKCDVGTQMLELMVRGYANDEDAAKAVREELAKIIRTS